MWAERNGRSEASYGSSGASLASWTITPTAVGSLTIEVELAGVMLTLAAGTAGSRTYTVASATTRRSSTLGLGLGL